MVLCTVPYNFRTKWTHSGPEKYMVSHLFRLILNVSALLSSAPGCLQCLKVCPYLLTRRELILLFWLSESMVPRSGSQEDRTVPF